MADELVAGVDCSTQSTKVVVVDAATGEQVALGRAGHEVTGRDGARETHPEVWWDALRDALADTGCVEQIRAISVAGQQHGLVVRDADGTVVRPAMLWNDTRSAQDAEDLVDDLGGAAAWAERIGTVPVASITVSKWAWLRRNEPEHADRAAVVRLPHDDVTSRLVGRSVTDRGDASGTGWWSTADGAYASEVLDLERVRLDVDLLPHVLAPDESAGTVTAEAARHTGLPEGIPVGPGTGDNAGAALGLGLARGQAVLSLGTSGTVYAATAERTADPTGTIAGFADANGGFLPLAATLNATQAVDRMAEWLKIDREAVAPAGGVVVLPFLDGERTPDLPRAAGSVLGLRHDTESGQILQATYDGVVLSLLDALGRIAEHAGGLGDGPLLLIGGGAKGRVWRETVQRLSGRAVVIPDIPEAVARGAAVQAGAVLAGSAPDDVVARWDDSDRAPTHEELPAVEPDEAARERGAMVRRLLEDLNTSDW